MIARLRHAAVTLAFAVVACTAAFAQEPANEFRPVVPGELGEQVAAAPLVYAAYSFVWFAFVAYLFLLWKRMKRVDADIKDLNAKLGARRG